MKLPRPIYNYILLFCILLLSGILFANVIFVLMAIVPFLLLMAGFILRMPSGISVERSLSNEKLYTGENLDVQIELHIQAGIGLVSFSDVVPKGFQLDEGSNLLVIWKGFSEKTIKINYSLKCITAGEYSFSKFVLETRHCLYGNTLQENRESQQFVEVTPQMFAAKKTKGLSGTSRIPMPLHATARIGIPTLDFKEIRLYGYGDSFKFINWKASSRNVFRGGFWPVINEYEKEGKKSVWIFMDGARTMDYGTSVKTLFDYGVEAACQLSDYYIRQQCYTAFCTYNEGNIFISPGMGKKQYYKILGETMEFSYERHLEERMRYQNRNSLERTIIKHRHHISGSKPLFVVITHGCEENFQELARGLKEMAKYSMDARQLLQVMVVNINGSSLTAETPSDQLANEIMGIRYSGFLQELKKRCIWVDWDPLKANLFDAILKRVV